MFYVFVITLWMLYTVLLKKRMQSKFSFSYALMPLVLFSYLVTIDLGINYVAGAIPQLNDGIGLHSHFAFYIIGDDGWSVELFKRMYDASFAVSLILTVVYAGVKLMDVKNS